MSHYDDDQFADADDEEDLDAVNMYRMNPRLRSAAMFPRRALPMRNAAAIGIFAGGPAYAAAAAAAAGYNRARAQASVAAAAAAHMARRHQAAAVAHANAWGDIQSAGQSMPSLAGNGSTWNALNHPTSLSSQLNDFGSRPLLSSTALAATPSTTTEPTYKGFSPGRPTGRGAATLISEQQRGPLVRQQQKETQILGDEDDREAETAGQESETVIPPVEHGPESSARQQAKRMSRGPAKSIQPALSKEEITVIIDEQVTARKKLKTTKSTNMEDDAEERPSLVQQPIEIDTSSSSPEMTPQRQPEKPTSTPNVISDKPLSPLLKPAPHKRQNRCFMIPDSLERQQVLLASKLVSEEIKQGTWMGNQSETRLQQAALALEQFAIEIILPSLEARATNVKYGAASNDRPLFATLLALREVMMLNTAAIFGEDALDFFEEDELNKAAVEREDQPTDADKKTAKTSTGNDKKEPYISTVPKKCSTNGDETGEGVEGGKKLIDTENHTGKTSKKNGEKDICITTSSTESSTNGDVTKTERESKVMSTNTADSESSKKSQKQASFLSAVNGAANNMPENTPCTTPSSSLVVSITIDAIPKKANVAYSPISREEEVFRANMLATGIIFASIERLGPLRSERIAKEMTTLIEKYDVGHEEFATCLEPADGRVRGVCPNKTLLDREENVTWRVHFNCARKNHPLFVKQMKRRALEKADALAQMVAVNEEGLVHRVTVASPNACHISMVEVAPNDL